VPSFILRMQEFMCEAVRLVASGDGFEILRMVAARKLVASQKVDRWRKKKVTQEKRSRGSF
jgi:hypothetical protein